MSSLLEINDRNIDALSRSPIMLFVVSSHCGACHALKPIIHQLVDALVAARSNVRVAIYDTTKASASTSRVTSFVNNHKIQFVPSLILFSPKGVNQVWKGDRNIDSFIQVAYNLEHA